MQTPTDAVPEIDIEIEEAILNPITHNSLRCFLRVTVRNQTEGAPCMIHNCILRLRIGNEWHLGGTLISVNNFQLVTCDQLADLDDVPLKHSFSLRRPSAGNRNRQRRYKRPAINNRRATSVAKRIPSIGMGRLCPKKSSELADTSRRDRRRRDGTRPGNRRAKNWSKILCWYTRQTRFKKFS
jgi:hypothetical protein